MDMTAGQVLKLFFEDYEGFKYEEEDVSDPDFGSSHGGKKYQRSGFREPFAITTMHAPMVNVAHGASKHTLKTLRDEILLANEKLGRNCGWDAVTGRGDGEAEREFLNGFGNFVKIDLQYWGKNIPRGRSLVGWIESRCVTLLVGKFPIQIFHGFYVLTGINRIEFQAPSYACPHVARSLHQH